jgi:hypothetical protein
LKQMLSGMDQEPVRNSVLAYADSYRDMAKQGVESVQIWSVITDLERNIAPLYAAPQPLTEAEPQFKAAVATLEHHGFTWNGGEQWKPPLGLPPAFISNDRAELEQYRKAAGEKVTPDYQSFEQWWERENGQPFESWEYQRCDGGYFDEAMDGHFASWNACRAAMLQLFGNSEQVGWIKCSDRMPERDGNYWGWWSDSKRQGPVWFIKSELQSQFQSSEITHWMPLPAAPQQE